MHSTAQHSHGALVWALLDIPNWVMLRSILEMRARRNALLSLLLRGFPGPRAPAGVGMGGGPALTFFSSLQLLYSLGRPRARPSLSGPGRDHRPHPDRDAPAGAGRAWVGVVRGGGSGKEPERPLAPAAPTVELRAGVCGGGWPAPRGLVSVDVT